MSTTLIEVRPAKAADAASVASTHDEAWRSAYQGIIPGAELEKLINRRGPQWWDSAIRKGSRVSVAGDLSTREHDGKTYLRVNASDVSLLGGGQQDGQRQDSGNRYQSGYAAQKPPAGAQSGYNQDMPDESDIPF